MTTDFYDLCVCPTEKDKNNLNLMFSILFNEFDFNAVALENYSLYLIGDVGYTDKKQIIPRITIHSNELKEVKDKIRHANNNVIICVNTQNRAAASWCARDTRVKILKLTLENIKKLHKNTISVASKNETFFEISIFDLLFDENYPFVKKLSLFSQKISEILKLGGDIVLTSSAKNKLQIRPPRDMLALASLFGVEEDDAKKFISENPKRIITLLRDP